MLTNKVGIYCDTLTEYRLALWMMEIEALDEYQQFKNWNCKLYLEDGHKLSKEEVMESIAKLMCAEFGEPERSVISDKSYLAKWEVIGENILLSVSMWDKEIDVGGLEPIERPLQERLIKILTDSKKFRTERARQEKVTVRYAFPTAQGLDIRHREFREEPFDLIRNNYTPDVQDEFANLLVRMNDSRSGLIVLNGPPGTGKTHLIRALLTELKGKRGGLVCVPPITFLTDISKLLDAVSAKTSSLVVFEDLGDVLTSAASSEHVEVFSNLVNVTDGLLSLLNDSLLLLSFNTDIGKINPAILRPGRCIGQIEIGELPVAQARDILLDDNLELNLSKQSYTLADIYEMKRVRHTLDANKSQNHVGFGIASK